jgi:hypothetical protein
MFQRQPVPGIRVSRDRDSAPDRSHPKGRLARVRALGRPPAMLAKA